MSRGDDGLRVRDLVGGEGPPRPRRRGPRAEAGDDGARSPVPQVVVETGGDEDSDGGAQLPFDPALLARGVWRRRRLVAAVLAASLVLSLAAALALPSDTWRVWTTVLRKSEQKEYLVTGTQPIVKLQIYSMPTLLRLVKVASNLDAVIERTGLEGVAPADLSRRITVENPRDTQLIEIILDWPDPDQAVAVVNVLAEVFVAEVDRLQKLEAIEAYDYLAGEQQAIRGRISVLERDLVTFKEEHEVVELSEQTGRLLQQLAEFDALARKERLDADMAEIAARRTAAELAEQAPTIVSSTFVRRPVQSRLVELETELAAALSVYTDEAPQVRELRDEVARVQELARRGVEEQLAEQTVSRNPVIASLEQTLVDRRVEAATRQARADGYTAVAADLRRRLLELPALESRLAELSQQLDTLRRLEGVVSSRVEEVRIIRDSTAGNLSIMQPARRPEYPQPSPARLVAVAGTVLGFGFALALATALELGDRRVKALSEVQSVLGVRPLGELGELEPGEVLVAGRRSGAVVDAHREIATSLLQDRPAGQGWVVMVTGAGAFEGRTSLVVNLAEVASRRGLEIVVVDADLRDPGLSELAPRLGVEPPERGLSDVLRGDAPVEDALAAAAVPGPTWLLAGTDPDPELLAGPVFAEVAATLAERFDLVLLDAPPALPPSEALMVATVADAVMLVVEAFGLDRAAHRLAIERLQSAGAEIVGAVLTKVPAGYQSPYVAASGRLRTAREASDAG